MTAKQAQTLMEPDRRHLTQKDWSSICIESIKQFRPIFSDDGIGFMSLLAIWETVVFHAVVLISFNPSFLTRSQIVPLSPQ
jgi:hypothetical protein